jgi:predicted metal-dependent hydrolase
MSIPLRSLPYRRTTKTSDLAVHVDGEVFPIRLRSHAQARRYTLRIHAATREIVLTMPPRGSIRQAREFAQKHGVWIAARLRRLPEVVPFVHGATVPVRGIDTRIEHRRGVRGTVWHECGEDGASLLCVAGEKPHVSRRVHDYLKREAKCDLDTASRAAAEALGVRIARISIRDQVGRWGSCSTTGGLSYSWRLVLAPPFVLEYLAAHEVAHLIEMNHSQRFWRLVDRICPHVSRAKAWLQVHGNTLHRYGMQK